MKVRDMFTKEFADKYCDLDVSEPVNILAYGKLGFIEVI